MSGSGPEGRRGRTFGILPLLLPLGLYLAFLALLFAPMGGQLNADAVAYVAKARAVAEGRFGDSVSSYWSPLLSWLLAPLLAGGVDALLACRLVTGAAGALLIAGVYSFGRLLPGASPWTASAAAALSVPVALHYSVTVISPDVLLAALLFAYLSLSHAPSLVDSRRLQAAAGLAAGVAFLAKAYALPFFLVHWSATVLLRRLAWFPARFTARRALWCWAAGVAAFAAVSLPWIGTMSLHYGRPTFSSVGKIALSFVGPQGRVGHPVHGLHRPPAGEKSVWESPDRALRYEPWSPLASAGNLRRQVRHTADAISGFSAMLGNFDAWGVGRILLLVLPVMLLGRGAEAFTALWFPVTVLTYLGGFALVYHGDDRYVVPLLWPLLCTFTVVFAGGLALASAGRGSLARWKALLLLSLAVLSFALGSRKAASGTAAELSPEKVAERESARAVAGALAARGLRGPLAVSAGHWDRGLAVAFHLDTVFLGDLAGEPPPAAVSALDEAGAALFLAAAGDPAGEALRASAGWRGEGAVRAGGSLYLVFRRVEERDGPPVRAAPPPAPPGATGP